MEAANIHTQVSPSDLKDKIEGLGELEQLRILNELIWENRHWGSGQFFDLAQLAVKLAVKNQIEIRIVDLAQAYLNLGNTAWNRSEPTVAFETLQKSQRLFRSIGVVGKACFAEAVMANLHSQKGEFESAFSLIFHILDEVKDQQEDEVEGLANLSAGSFHFDLESYKEALNYFLQSLECFSRINDEVGVARATNNAGMSLHKLGRNDEGLEYCERSLEIYTKLAMDQGRAKSKRDIGKILEGQGKLEEALACFQSSLEIRDHGLQQKASGVDGVITCLMDIGNVLTRLGRPIESKEHLTRAMELSESSKAVPKLIKIHRRLSDVYKQDGNFEMALHHMEIHQDLKKDMLGQETANKIKMMQTRYALDLVQKESELEKAKNEELNLAYQRINTINKNLTDSLKYAKRIQNAFLPSRQRFRLTYPESYILNLPKDIVSGDFYWITQKNGFHLLAVADCSGHGVPGAFMSMVGMSLLNQIVNERGVLQPGKILNQINLALINNLNQMNEEGSTEGMDIGLCVFDPNFTQVVYAGAKRPLYYISDGQINELKSTPASIGFDPYTDFSERTHRIELSNVDQIILATDGYSDQFGEATGKKLMVSKFKDMLVKQYQNPIEEQEAYLRDYYLSWKGRESQTDDVLVVGIKLK
ncbi:MAG TPA: tetratricopeptide repeat protein [Catalimonadaceae bacterium]|nr:tetratricopeptide repeat protein [Catalimonadaceae bacterium]HPI10212.1 tetratricopeptide repeat protein [Catalimonadaceae bacterium]